MISRGSLLLTDRDTGPGSAVTCARAQHETLAKGRAGWSLCSRTSSGPVPVPQRWTRGHLAGLERDRAQRQF